MGNITNAFVLVAGLLQCAVADATFQQKCLAFAPQQDIFNSTLAVLDYVPAGTNISLPDNDPSCNTRSQVAAVELCRAALHIPTSNRSSLVVELWLPEKWSGRVLAVGNGGIDGCESAFVLSGVIWGCKTMC